MSSLSEQVNPSPKIYIPEEWSAAADSIAYDSTTSLPPIALICGAKNCGKTTFSRYLLNVLLQRVSLSQNWRIAPAVTGVVDRPIAHNLFKALAGDQEDLFLQAMACCLVEGKEVMGYQ